MTLKNLLTTALIASTVVLTACANNSIEETAPNAIAEVSMDIKEVPSDSAEKPAMSATRSVLVTSTVIGIDHKTRLVTIKDDQGKPVTFTAGKDVQNLDQVNAGDTVKAEYIQSFSLRVLEAKNIKAAAGEVAAITRADKGSMPGMAVVGSKVEVFIVDEINLTSNTFKLKNETGAVREFKARNPENLKKAAVGDVVVMTYTEGFAISVEEMPAK